MANPKEILVTTTSSCDGLTVKQYLKPISAHIVAGTNLFSDFLASFADVFGGRSQTYQKQLSSLYNESIERLKIAAFEIGANCIIGLDDETWDFITRNHVYEVFDFILDKLKSLMPNPNDTSGISEEFYEKLLSYIDALPENEKNRLLYGNVVNNQSEQVRAKLYEIIA